MAEGYIALRSPIRRRFRHEVWVPGHGRIDSDVIPEGRKVKEGFPLPECRELVADGPFATGNKPLNFLLDLLEPAAKFGWLRGEILFVGLKWHFDRLAEAQRTAYPGEKAAKRETGDADFWCAI